MVEGVQQGPVLVGTFLMQWMHWYLFDAMGFVACITWTEKARQHQ